jgi:hypothetical protein
MKKVRKMPNMIRDNLIMVHVPDSELPLEFPLHLPLQRRW